MTRTVKAQSDRYKCPFCKMRCSVAGATVAIENSVPDGVGFRCPCCFNPLLLPAEGSTNWRKPEVSKP